MPQTPAHAAGDDCRITPPKVGSRVACRSPRRRPSVTPHLYARNVTERSFQVVGPASSSRYPRFLENAACGLNPAWWAVDGVEEVEAYLICVSCGVRADCRAYALNHPDLSGIWAATTKQERADMRRRWQPSDAPSDGVEMTAAASRLGRLFPEARTARAWRNARESFGTSTLSTRAAFRSTRFRRRCAALLGVLKAGDATP